MLVKAFSRDVPRALVAGIILREMCKSSLSFTAGTNFAKRVVTGQGIHMIQLGLFCEMGQFTKASQSKDKTLNLEVLCRGYREEPTRRVRSVSGSLGQGTDRGSWGLAAAKRIKRRHKGRMVVRHGSATSPHSPGEYNNKILLDLTPTLHTDVEIAQVRLLTWALKAMGKRGCLIPAILMGGVVWGCKFEFGDLA